MSLAAAENLHVSRVTGDGLRAIIPDVARLRVSVFRAWPYLYDGDVDYENAYLQTYLRSPQAAVIVARHEGRVVGASTCLPLADETENVQAPFVAAGCDPAKFAYFGESVLLPALRGQGVGVAFFREREAHARTLGGCEFAAFCAVQRPENHPARPSDDEPLDGFWTRRGFTRRADLRCTMRWRDVGDVEETEKQMVFWLKSLADSPLP